MVIGKNLARYGFIGVSLLYGLFTLYKILDISFELQDFRVYYQGVQNAYSEAGITQGWGNIIYPPSALLLLTPIILFPIDIAEQIWTILSFSSIVIAFTYLIAAVKTTEPKPFHIALLVSAAVWLFPIKFTLGMGQVNHIILAILAAAFYYHQKGKPVLSGSLIGIAGAIKITPLILGLYFVRKKSLLGALGTLLSFVLLTIVSGVVLGGSTVIEYFSYTLWSLPTIGNDAYYNQALTGFLARSSIPDTYSYFINYLILMLLIIFGWRISSHRTQLEPRVLLAEYGYWITILLIAGGLTWQHHLSLLLIPMAALYLNFLKVINYQIISLFVVSYILIAWNIKNPLVFDTLPRSLVLSHGLYGTILILLLLTTVLKGNRMDAR